MSGRVRSSWTVFLSLALVALSVAPAHAEGVPTQADPSVNESYPAPTAGSFAWSQEDVRMGRVDVFARSGGEAWQVNAPRKMGSVSRPVTGTTSTIIYQQFTPDRGGSELFLYDLSTRTREKLPSEVDTAAWEYWGAASTRYVLFMRAGDVWRDLLLFDRRSGDVQRLARVSAWCSGCLEPTWVGDTHAIFTRCRRVCNVVVLDIPARTVTKVPSEGAPYLQTGGVMDERSGDVYFLRTTFFCGLFVEVRKWGMGQDDPGAVYRLGEGVDGWRLAIAPSPGSDGHLDLFYEAWDCLEQDQDLYMVAWVDTLAPLVPIRNVATPAGTGSVVRSGIDEVVVGVQT